MGVRGLTTFINREKRFYENYRLHSTKLVIDGCGLAPTIYYDSDLNIDPGNHGGEHQTYYIHCAQFFRNMLSCGVECYVIFDGGYDRNGLKFETLKKREQASIDSMKELNETGEGVQTIATYYMLVFTRVLDDLDVDWVSSEFEADRDIAVLANEFKCPVLGQDSDFFIMNIEEGYIPLDSLNWKKLCSIPYQSETESCQPLPSECQAAQNYLESKRFRLRAFSTYFQVMPSIMPIFASLSGNDYLQGFNLSEFYAGIKQRHQKPDGRPHPHRKGYWRFCNLLHHLTYFTTVAECIEEVLQYVHIDERSKIKAALQESCSMYDVTSFSDVAQFFREQNLSSQSDETLSNDPKNPSTGEGTDDEDVEEGILMPGVCESILRQKTVFLNVQTEKLSNPRASACCDHLIRILAGIMLENKVAEEDKNERRMLTFDVFHREKYTLTCTKMEPVWNVTGFGNVPFYKEVPRMSKSSRLSFLLAALNVQNVHFNNIPESFHLMLLASIYCYKNADPPVSATLLQALVLGWIQGVAWYQDNTQKLQEEGRLQTDEKEFDISWDGYEVQTVLQNYEPLTRKSLRESLDFDISHAFMQWISCNKYTRFLNIMLQDFLPRLDVRIWYNGILIHNLYFRLTDIHPSRHQNWIENGLLLDAPSAYDFYRDLMSFLTQNLNFPTNSKGDNVPLPSKESAGKHQCSPQRETRGHNEATSKGSKESSTLDFSCPKSERKKHRRSKKNRGKKAK